MPSCWILPLLLAVAQTCKGSQCLLPEQGRNLYLRCSVGDKAVPCGGLLNAGTSLGFQCAEFYVLEDGAPTEIQCLPFGNWSHTTPKCVPACGKLGSAVPLIVRGEVVPAGSFPWQAALYHRSADASEGWEFWCGASLISPRIILTAAHCAWKIPAEDLKVALGKKFREYKMDGESPQIIQVVEVDMLDSYQDVGGNYNGDLALLLLKDTAELSPTVSPICIDWDQKFIDVQLTEGNTGIALGWGLTENDTFSSELRAVRLPVMSDERCIQQQQRDFKKYVTYTSFCAGYTNGTGVCNGDSGGGLVFVDVASDTWYLQGVVSVSPRRRGTPYCDPTFYTVFTKVAMFTQWLHKMEDREREMEEKEARLPGTVLQHSDKILASIKNPK